MTPRHPEETPPSGPNPETPEQHTGRDDVTQGLNSNLNSEMGGSGADREATEQIVDQQRQSGNQD